MVRSHVKAPAVYLKHFRVKQGAHPNNRDPIYVYDKKTISFDFKKNSRGKWVEIIDFYSQEIEQYNQIFEDEYNQSYKEICNSFKIFLMMIISQLIWQKTSSEKLSEMAIHHSDDDMGIVHIRDLTLQIT